MTERAARTRSESCGSDGAAPVDFVLLVGLLTALFLMVVQLGVALHVRNVLTSAAAEGARYGANADFTDHTDAAQQQTAAIISTELDPRFAQNVQASVVDVDGQPVVEVAVSAPLPLIGFWGSARTVLVYGHALQEGG